MSEKVQDSLKDKITPTKEVSLFDEIKEVIGPSQAIRGIYENRIYLPSAIKNPHMDNENPKHESEINGNIEGHRCWGHEATGTTGTTSKLKETKSGQKIGTTYICRNPECSLYGFSFDIYAIFGVLVEGVEPAEAVTKEGRKKFLSNALRFYAKLARLEHKLTSYDPSTLSPEDLAVYRKNQAVNILHRFFVDCFMGRNTRPDVQKLAKEARDYYLKGWITENGVTHKRRGFMYAYWDSSLPEDIREETAIKLALEDAEKDGVFFAPGFALGYEHLKRNKLNFTNEELLEASLISPRYKNGKETGEYRDYHIKRLGLPLSKDLNTGVKGLYGRALDPDSKPMHLKPRNNRAIYDLDNALRHKILLVGEGEWTLHAAKKLLSEKMKGKIPKDQEDLLLPIGVLPLGGSSAFQDVLIEYVKDFFEKHKGEYTEEIVLVGDADKAGQSTNFEYGKLFTEIGAKLGIVVSIMIIKDDENEKFDINDMLTKYKELARPRLRKLFDERISFEAFAINYVLSQHDLSSEHGQRIAFRKTTEYIRHLKPHEQLLIAKRVCRLIDEKDPTFFVDNEDRNTFLAYLLATWKLIQQEIVEQGFAESCKYRFLILTQNVSVYDTLRERYKCANVVWVNNRSRFLSLWKKAQENNPTVPKTAFLDLTFTKEQWKETEQVATKLWQLAADLPTLQTSSEEELPKFFRETAVFENQEESA